MIKIIWNRDDFLKVKDELTKKFNLKIIDDPNEVPNHKIGLLLKEENEESLKSFIKTLLLESYQMIFETFEGFVQIQIKEICYLESFGEEITMHLEKMEKIIIKEPLYKLEEKLKHYHFVRISKSFIVNVMKIRYIKTSFNAKLDLELLDGRKIQVTRSYVKSFKDALGI